MLRRGVGCGDENGFAGKGESEFGEHHLEGVGRLLFFEDTEGNLVGAMKYDKGLFD